MASSTEALMYPQNHFGAILDISQCFKAKTMLNDI